MVRNGDPDQVKLSRGEWLKFTIGVVTYTAALVTYFHTQMGEVKERLVVVEQRSELANEDRERIRTIEADVKRILERLPR